MVAGSVKRFGTRYGRRLKERFGLVEAEQKKLYECPQCLKKKVKRVSLGIWQCRSCNLKFAGKAYSVRKKVRIIEKVAPEEIAPEESQESEEEKEG